MVCVVVFCDFGGGLDVGEICVVDDDLCGVVVGGVGGCFFYFLVNFVGVVEIFELVGEFFEVFDIEEGG